MKIRIDAIKPNPHQPRRIFDQSEIESLAESIEEHDQLQAILVEQAGGEYLIIDGERRWRAMLLLGRPEIEATIRVSDDGNLEQDRYMAALIANVQRTDLNLLEEALAYQKMYDEFGMSVQEIADATGRSFGTVMNRRFLLTLEPEIQRLFSSGALPFDYPVMSAIASLPDDTRLSMALKFAQRGVSSRLIISNCKKLAKTRETSNNGNKPKKLVPVQPAGQGFMIEGSEYPALRLAATRTKKPVSRGHYDALAAAGVVPPWLKVESAVKQECRSCDLFGQASEVVCRTCPLPGFLKRLIEEK